MTLKRRISALEMIRQSRTRFIVAVGPKRFDPLLELSARGVEVTAADTLVVIRKPVDAAVTMTVDGQAY